MGELINLVFAWKESLYPIVPILPGNGWQEAKIPFDKMDVSWRGRPLSKSEYPLLTSKIRSIEFMIYDKQDGPFKLQVDWIKSY